jgi:hypothetical protein
VDKIDIDVIIMTSRRDMSKENFKVTKYYEFFYFR